jgi:hypothetical protein
MTMRRGHHVSSVVRAMGVVEGESAEQEEEPAADSVAGEAE